MVKIKSSMDLMRRHMPSESVLIAEEAIKICEIIGKLYHCLNLEDSLIMT